MNLTSFGFEDQKDSLPTDGPLTHSEAVVLSDLLTTTASYEEFTDANILDILAKLSQANDPQYYEVKKVAESVGWKGYDFDKMVRDYLEKQPAHVNPLNLIPAVDLLQKEIPPPRYIIDNVIPEGVSILSSRPKKGKSWMVLNLGMAVASGGIALGHVAVEQGDALYIALEDNERRMQGRMRRLLSDHDIAPDRLEIVFDCAKIEDGLESQLRDWCHSVDNPRLIIIDTLVKARRIRKSRGDIYQADNETISWLQKLANEYQLAILFVHHLNKAYRATDDIHDAVLGSTGITGAADTIMVLDRPNGAKEAKLSVNGRDVGDYVYALEFNEGIWIWRGMADEWAATQEQVEIIALLKHAGEPLSIKDIAVRLNLDYNVAAKRLQRMVEAGLLSKPSRGMYALSPSAFSLDTDEACQDVKSVKMSNSVATVKPNGHDDVQISEPVTHNSSTDSEPFGQFDIFDTPMDNENVKSDLANEKEDESAGRYDADPCLHIDRFLNKKRGWSECPDCGAIL